MASTSSSHQQNAFSGIEPPNNRRKIEESSRVFDVFINHRGPDVKQTLATQLYKSLKKLGISAFLDSEEKERGVSFISTIETAIRSASVHIAIFSPKYAESDWCLRELVLMLESNAKIIPVFYQVEPCHLRYIKKGVYAKAFSQYKAKRRYLDKLEEWKEALQKVSYTAGDVFKESDFGDCKDIVSAVEKEVQRTKRLHVAKYPVGLHKLVKDFERQCLDKLVQDFESKCGMKQAAKEKGNIVGIFGMGGVGKTTLSKELFNQKKSKYTRASFLFDVRETCATGKLPSLQSKLLKDIFGEDQIFQSSEDGTNFLRDRLKSSSSFSFLIVLDDIDHVKQLDDLLVTDILNKSGNNLVIITTRNAGVLVSAGIDIGYHLKGLNRQAGSELFCWYAFEQPLPRGGYEDLVQDFVNVCGGLPLSLIVLGRHVYGRDQWYWQDELEKARKALPGDVKKRLKISFDALDNEEQQIFMDIACFFLEKSITTAVAVWEGYGWKARHALQTLKEKCLVEEVQIRYLSGREVQWESSADRSALRMHDHLRDLGREMANELNHPHRLWRPQDLKSLELKGFQNILTQTKSRCFHSIVDKSIGCRITYFLGERENVSDASLLWLQLEYLSRCPLDLNSDINSSIPRWIPLEKLQCLRIANGCFKKLWQSDVQAPSHLEELQIRDSSVEEFPDLLGKSNNMKKIVLNAKDIQTDIWSLLESLRMNLISLRILGSGLEGHLAYNDTAEGTALESSVIYDFKRLWEGEVALNNEGWSRTIMFDCKNIVNLSIRYCTELEKLPCLMGPSCLKRIVIDGCGNLKYLRLDGLENLESLSGNLELTRLDIIECPALKELPRNFREIKIDSCEKLESIELPTTLSRLYVEGCRNLHSVVAITDLTELEWMLIKQCPALEELPSFAGVGNLREIRIESCEKLQKITLPTTLSKLYVEGCRNLHSVVAIPDLTELEWMLIKQCPALEKLPSFASVGNFGKIQIKSCEKLQNITLPTTLIGLYVEGCRNLHSVVTITDLTELEWMLIKQGPALEEIKIESCEKLQNITLPTTLSRLSVKGCRNLQGIAGITDLTKLEQAYIAECPKLDLACLSRLSCTKRIVIESCENLQNITAIEELHVPENATLTYCICAVVRIFIDKWRSMPKFTWMIGRAVDGAELHVPEIATLTYCSCAVVRNFIDKWKIMISILLSRRQS